MNTLPQSSAGLARDWREARRRHPRTVLAVAALFAVTALAPLAGGVRFLAGLRTGLPDRAAIGRIGDMNQATAVFDASDRLAFTIFKEQRIEVPLAEVSPNLIHALLAIEDQRFYAHHGLDLVRMASATLTNIRQRRAAQGGSTITQQLARQSFLVPDKTLHRKFQELILADQLERSYSKARILELYLNKVYFGDGLYGVEAASRGYFGKHASELTMPEAALLAGLVKSPSTYAPTVSMERAVARRNLVLQAMLDTHAIDRPTWRSARAAKVVLHDDLRAGELHGQYFKEQLRIEMVERFGWQRVYQGGLRVYSTIDMPMQRAAESVVADSLAALDERRRVLAAHRAAVSRKTAESDEAPLQAALLALDPRTGQIRAMVGGRDFATSHFNRAVQAHRQPGSAFKPFVYAAALEAGYTPATVLDNLDEPVATAQGAWTPEDEHSTAQSMTLRTALRTSSNRAAVRLLQQVGIARTVKYARDLGVGDVPSVPSLALGSGEVTLQSMTAAYAAFANHGLVPQPMLIRRVEDQDGEVLYEAHPSSSRAITDTTAFLTSSMLTDVINAGTGSRARQLGFMLPAAGKTGTTNGFKDAWFVGFTPTLVTGVWVGFDQPRTILPNGFAADIAVPVWAKFMKAATRGDKPEWLEPPSGVTTANVCRLSGQLATDGCQNVEVVEKDGQLVHRSMIYSEYFAPGTEPTTSCDLHPARGIMTKLAGLFSAEDKPAALLIEDTGLLPVPAVTFGKASRIENPPLPPARKRGFWSKVFGGGRDNERDKSEDPQELPKKKGGG